MQIYYAKTKYVKKLYIARIKKKQNVSDNLSHKNTNFFFKKTFKKNVKNVLKISIDHLYFVFYTLVGDPNLTWTHVIIINVIFQNLRRTLQSIHSPKSAPLHRAD